MISQKAKNSFIVTIASFASIAIAVATAQLLTHKNNELISTESSTKQEETTANYTNGKHEQATIQSNDNEKHQALLKVNSNNSNSITVKPKTDSVKEKSNNPSEETANNNTQKEVKQEIGTKTETSQVKAKTQEEKAVERMRFYISTKPYDDYSRSSYISILRNENYTYEQAVYAIDSLNIDWNKQILKHVKNRMISSSLYYCSSPYNIDKPLENAGFTDSEIAYITNNSSVDWPSATKRCIESTNKQFSKEQWRTGLANIGFSQTYISSALNNANVDWLEHAKSKLKSDISANGPYSQKTAINRLTNYFLFTNEEAKEASKIIDWKEQAVLYAKKTINSNKTITRYRLIEKMEQTGFTEEQAIYAVNKLNYYRSEADNC